MMHLCLVQPRLAFTERSQSQLSAEKCLRKIQNQLCGECISEGWTGTYAKQTCAEQVDGVQRLDIGSHVLNPCLQVVGWVVGDVVLFGTISGLTHHNVQLCLGARLVHQVVPQYGGIIPAPHMALKWRVCTITIPADVDVQEHKATTSMKKHPHVIY